MKQLSFILLLLSTTGLFAQEKTVNARLNEVTVYRSCARETRETSTSVGAGQTELVLSAIPLAMQDQSLQVSIQGQADLISAQVRTRYIPLEDQKKQESVTTAWLDSLQSMEYELRWITEEKSIINDQIGLLDFLSRQVDASSGYKPSNIQASVDYYSSQSMLMRKRNFDLMIREEQLNNRRNDLQLQLNNSNEIHTKAIKEIVLRINTDQAVNLELAVSYLTGSAGWLPFYDVRVENTSSPVDLTAKAKIFQSTGNDWNNVQLSISTLQPGLNNNRPLMSPQYIDYVTYRFNAIDNNANFGVSNMMQVERITPSLKNSTATTATGIPELLPDFSFDSAEKDVMEEYNIPRKMTIISDARENICELFQLRLPASYRYHAVPKLDPAAFLLARITDFGKHNLLAGDANVFFGDKYIGQVDFNPRTVQDTMLVSLGRDESILIKRTRVNASTGKKILSGNEEEIFTYQTTIKNNKKQVIEIEILDQIPLSRKEEIKVDLISRDKADYNKKFGKLMWTLNLSPGQSKTVNFSYSVTSPEGKPVEEIR